MKTSTAAPVHFTPDSDRFPEQELEALAKWHDDAAKRFPGTFGAKHKAAAKTCRDAIKSQDSLRERFLNQTVELHAALAASLPEKE